MGRKNLPEIIFVVIIILLIGSVVYFILKSTIFADVGSVNSSYADINADGKINKQDYLEFIKCWQKYNNNGDLVSCKNSDLNYDLAVDSADFAFFAYYWRQAGNTIDIDFDKDKKTTDLDFAIFKNCWAQYNGSKVISSNCKGTDLDENRKIDALDSSIFATFWRYSGKKRVGDVDSSGSVDSNDYSKFKKCWDNYNVTQKITSDCVKSDINGDKRIDALDFSKFSLSWRVFLPSEIK